MGINLKLIIKNNLRVKKIKNESSSIPDQNNELSSDENNNNQENKDETKVFETYDEKKDEDAGSGHQVIHKKDGRLIFT